ncbi:MAG: hypothetical protein IJ496_10420 [Ruminococcus sp.]|nr:hypothetical protein [Ruminococcus sp.]
MRKRKFSVLAVLTAALSVLAGCQSGEEYTIHVKNLTGAEISEIVITPDSDQSEQKNLLEENLAADGEIDLTIGRFTEEELEDGFAVVVYNAEDGSYGTFSMLQIDNGDTVSFYLDDWGLAVAVDLTEEEIEEQIAQDHQNYLEMLEEMEEEAAAEESAAETE